MSEIVRYATEEYVDSKSIVVITEETVPPEGTVLTYMIHNIVQNGGNVVFKSGDTIYQLDCAEIDPSYQAVFYNINQNGLDRVIITGSEIEFEHSGFMEKVYFTEEQYLTTDNCSLVDNWRYMTGVFIVTIPKLHINLIDSNGNNVYSKDVTIDSHLWSVEIVNRDYKEKQFRVCDLTDKCYYDYYLEIDTTGESEVRTQYSEYQDNYFNAKSYYTKNEIDKNNTLKSEVLTLTNRAEYTPTTDYHPATKKYVDDNVPHVVSEKVVLTVPAATITAKKTEIDNANLEQPATISIDNTMVYDPTKIYCLKYNNIQYRGVYITDRVTIAEDKCLCTFIPENGKTILMIGKLDTTNITDIQLIEKDVKKLDGIYLPNDLKVSNSITVGVRSGKIGTFSSSLGLGCEASSKASHAEGNSTKASGETSHAEGIGSIASGITSHAEGDNTIASGECQHVQGRYNIEDTTNKYAHIVGNGTDRAKSNAHTLDWKGNAWYAGQVEGTNLPYNISSKVLTTVPASDIKLNDEITINNVSINKDRRYYIEFLGSKYLCNFVINDENSGNEISCTIGNYAIEGMIFSSNLMLGVHKMSADDTAIDTFTDLVIYEEEIKCLDNKYLENDLKVQNSISLGRVGNIGTESSAIGMVVEASGMGSHAEGYGAKAIGNFSHAEGSFTEALEEDAHAEGNNTIASSMYQHVQGKNNIEDAEGKYAHIVGNGEDFNNRANAHTLDWEGNAWFAGKLSQEATPTEDKDLATKKYVDDNVLTPAAKTLLATLLQNIPYSTDQSANVTAFLRELGVDTTQTTK